MKDEVCQLEPAHADLARQRHRMQGLLPRLAVAAVGQDHQPDDADAQHGSPGKGKDALPQYRVIEHEDDEIGQEGRLDAGAGQDRGSERPACLREDQKAGQHQGMHDQADIGADECHRCQR